ncbi:MAG TPA: glycosyltransferase family 2 protein [Burkholderiaceae bacterium]|jgi:glycosyltransferase involved in cell wall biosynthesis|nr:glycosyltransferase family 2 protein [Burkholderiaceae bacterium]
MLISVVVATYNRPDALAAVLRSLSKQDDRQFEVVVADDGSKPETEAVVRRAQATASMPLSHVWQEDTGFRLAAVRNRATARAHGNYLIYLDGDCIVRRHFVRAHRELAEAGWCVTGGRVLLSEAFTRNALTDETAVEDWSVAGATLAAIQGKVNRASTLARLPLGPLRKFGGRRWQRLRGCNFSAFRTDIERVNGFDECFQGWGFEDSDFAARLIESGVRLKYGRMATNVYHLWHPEQDRTAHGENWERLQARIRARETRAVRGLDQYRKDHA